MLCPHCGNEIEPGEECPVCAAVRERKRAARAARRRLCVSCGNEIFGEDPCPICASGRAVRRREPRPRRLTLCTGCGNEVEDPADCPICRSGRGGRRPARADNAPHCPQCGDPLEHQDWEGADVLVCPGCQGCLFLGRALEEMLDRLRASTDPKDLPEVLAEFRDRCRGALPKAVRYKACPLCDSPMTRRNYAGVSGIIIDVCPLHGTWVDQATFGELSDFVSRGGDLFARRSPLR